MRATENGPHDLNVWGLTMADALILLIVFLWAALVVVKIVRDKKSGKCTGCCTSSCTGSCAHCHVSADFDSLIQREIDRKKGEING